MDMAAHEANDVTDPQGRFQRATGPAGRSRMAGRVVPSDGGARDAAANGRAASSGRVIASRYLLEEQIGEGAHATTWRGHDRRLKRSIAIKMLRAHLTTDPELVARFVREAELAASISHPNVVDVYDVGTDNGTSYIVMRYVPGRDLRDLLRGDGRLALSQTVPIVRQVLLGLGAIHAAGIVHRDVKPQNILITPDGTAQVTDFGVAYAALAEGLTTQGMTVGTAAYMAPEQARGGRVSPATDIYAVGVVMYEMLTGRPPYAGDNPMAVMFAHLHDMPPTMASVAPGLHLPAGVEPLVRRAMAREPAQRFPSARAMIQALSADLAAGPDAATTVRTSAAAAAPAEPYADQPTVVTRPAEPPHLPGGPTSGRSYDGEGGAPPRNPTGNADRHGHGRWWFMVSVVFLALAAVILAAALRLGPFGDGNATVTSLPAIAPSRNSSAPAVVATVTMTPTPTPTDTAPPMVTAEPPTATSLPSTETPMPPTVTMPPPTATDLPPTAPPTMTAAPPTSAPPTETAVPVELDPTQQINPVGSAPLGQASTANEIVSANAPGNGNGNDPRQSVRAAGTPTPPPTTTPKPKPTPKPKHTPKAHD